jgi:hypothetical protein
MIRQAEDLEARFSAMEVAAVCGHAEAAFMDDPGLAADLEELYARVDELWGLVGGDEDASGGAGGGAGGLQQQRTEQPAAAAAQGQQRPVRGGAGGGARASVPACPLRKHGLRPAAGAPGPLQAGGGDGGQGLGSDSPLRLLVQHPRVRELISEGGFA